MSSTHKVEFVEADCGHCRRSFPIPLLGDQSYGLFVLYGERGGVFGYLSAFECPSFEDIRARLLAIAGLKKFMREESTHFQEVMASCADEIDGQLLGLIPVCPYCRSGSIIYGESRPLNVREIRGVTFTRFQSLSDAAKTQKLTELWNHGPQNP
jgi:hypothetical protein